MEYINALISEPLPWSEEQERVIKEPYNYLALHPGKNIRSKLIRIFNRFYKLSSEHVETIDKFIEILHVSSLLIDDIEDNSPTRRGQPSSHLVYGVPMTVNAANYMYFISMSLLRKLAGEDQNVFLKLLSCFNEEMINLHRGQGLDIYWRDKFIIPTEEQYYYMVMNKTGGLFRMTAKIMECLQPAHGSSLVPLSNLLGILYQVRDDYMNLVDPEMIRCKGFASDITEGKLSFPIIHALGYAREHDQEGFEFLCNTLRTNVDDGEIKDNMVKYIENVSHSLAYTRIRIRELTELIKEKYVPNHDKELSEIIGNLSSL